MDVCSPRDVLSTPKTLIVGLHFANSLMDNQFLAFVVLNDLENYTLPSGPRRTRLRGNHCCSSKSNERQTSQTACRRTTGIFRALAILFISEIERGLYCWLERFA